jgi:hypothetical protein
MASVITHRKRQRSSIFEVPQVSSERKSKTTVISSSAIHSDLINSLLDRRREIKSISTAPIDAKVERLKQESREIAGKRWMINREKDIQLELKKLDFEKKEILSGLPLIKFDNSMRPVMRRLKNANENRKTSIIHEAEREVRKRITKSTDAICLQRAAIGDMCEDCGVSMRVIANDSLLGCPQCAKTRIISAVSAPVADSEFVSIPYAQKSRLVEWLEFCQGKEYAEPSPEVLEMIMGQLVAQRSTGLEDFMSAIAIEREANGPYVDVESSIQRLSSKIPKLREKLLMIRSNLVRVAMQNASCTHQDNRLRKFYERAPKYSAYISGFWPLRFTNRQEERIRSLYAVAMPAYEKYRKPSQPNWPGGYAYFLRCLCVLLGWDEFVDHFNISAGQKNVHEREAVREKIWTQDLDWEYVPCSPPSQTASIVLSKKK